MNDRLEKMVFELRGLNEWLRKSLLWICPAAAAVALWSAITSQSLIRAAFSVAQALVMAGMFLMVRAEGKNAGYESTEQIKRRTRWFALLVLLIYVLDFVREQVAR